MVPPEERVLRTTRAELRFAITLLPCADRHVSTSRSTRGLFMGRTITLIGPTTAPWASAPSSQLPKCAVSSSTPRPCSSAARKCSRPWKSTFRRIARSDHVGSLAKASATRPRLRNTPFRIRRRAAASSSGKARLRLVSDTSRHLETNAPQASPASSAAGRARRRGRQRSTNSSAAAPKYSKYPVNATAEERWRAESDTPNPLQG